MPLSLAERFWAKVDRRDPDECWPWTGTCDPSGYGRISTQHGRSPRRTNRVCLELKLGRPIAVGMRACHDCDNPPCCNPKHLYEGTQKRNIGDMIERGRQNPRSLLNLRPGAPGVRGAGPRSRKELADAVAQ